MSSEKSISYHFKLLRENKDWKSYVAKSHLYDFYHTYDYHNISCDPSAETPILVTYRKGNVVIALPLLLRSIANSTYFDFTSVYGYAGPLSKDVGVDFDNKNYIEQLQAYFKSKNIVSVFTRLHPYMEEQSKILSNFGNLTALGRVVNINVVLPVEESRRAYQKSLKK